jgi:hypothetical protein
MAFIAKAIMGPTSETVAGRMSASNVAMTHRAGKKTSRPGRSSTANPRLTVPESEARTKPEGFYAALCYSPRTQWRTTNQSKP